MLICLKKFQQKALRSKNIALLFKYLIKTPIRYPHVEIGFFLDYRRQGR